MTPPPDALRMASEIASSRSSSTSYAGSLGQLECAAYRDKLALIEGLDPYTVSSDAIARDVEALPRITHHDIFNFLLFSPSRFSIDDMKDCENLEAYNTFFRGWVREVGVVKVKEDTCVVRALVSVARVHGLRFSLAYPGLFNIDGKK